MTNIEIAGEIEAVLHSDHNLVTGYSTQTMVFRDKIINAKSVSVRFDIYNATRFAYSAEAKIYVFHYEKWILASQDPEVIYDLTNASYGDIPRGYIGEYSNSKNTIN